MATKTEIKSDTTKVIPCTCYHAEQDRLYGTGNRLHNHAKSHPNKEGGWRCTVCGKEKSK